MVASTIARLTTCRTIVAVKEGSGSVQQASEIIQLCGERLTVLAGDDALTLPMMAVGGKGVITVTANLFPDKMAELVNAFLAGRLEDARAMHYRLYPLFAALFYETNPIPVKEALHMMGKIENEMRLPLCAMGSDNREKLFRVMKEAGLV
jgi:4-hydroxy-tetrahydrodipicolinate synthase